MFLIRPLPKKYEHLLAFMLRVSWLNHMRKLTDLLWVCGLGNQNNRIAYKKTVLGEFNTNALVAWLNVNPELITNNRAEAKQHFTEYFGKTVPYCMLDLKAPKFCPECLRNTGYLNAQCAIRGVSYCVKHRLCFPSKWENGEDICWNSQDFWLKVNTQSLHTRHATQQEIELNTLIQQLWHGDNATGLNTPLHLLELKDLLLLLRFVRKFHPDFKQLNAKEEPPSTIWAEAFQYLQDWPANIHLIFGYYEHHPMTSNRGEGIRATYRDLYDEIYSSKFSHTYAYFCLRLALEYFVTSKSFIPTKIGSAYD